MRICPIHWSAMKQAVDDRGMTFLVSGNGQKALEKMTKKLEGFDDAETFDPLMSIMWAVINNTMTWLEHAGVNPLYFLSAGPEDVIQGHPELEVKTWPRCPLCYINIAHQLACDDPNCTLEKINGYDWTIERAAGDTLERARKLKLMPPPS